MFRDSLNTISSIDIPYSVERFLAGPRELRFQIDYRFGERTVRWEMPCRTRTGITAFFGNPDRVAAFRRNPDAVARLIRQCRRFVAVEALQKGLVEPFNVVRHTDNYAATTSPALAIIPASIPCVYPPLSLGAVETRDKSDLVSKWAKETAPDPRWLYQTRLSMKRFAAVAELGHDDATRVTKLHVIRFKEKLSEQGLSAGTINRYLSEIKGPLEWGFKNEKIGSNPAEGVVFARKSAGKKTKRLGYTDEQARLILLSARDEEQPYRRWMPWLCAFTGARLDEVAGRKVADIEKVGSCWVLNIPEGKTPGSVRKVPLHLALTKEGFIADYVAGLPKNGPLFPDLTPDRFGRRAGSATKRIGRWLRGLQKETGVLLVDAKLYAPNHSWRHRFKSEARRVRIEEEVHDALTGHRDGKVSRDYGEYYVQEVLDPAVQSMMSPLDIGTASNGKSP